MFEVRNLMKLIMKLNRLLKLLNRFINLLNKEIQKSYLKLSLLPKKNLYLL